MAKTTIEFNDAASAALSELAKELATTKADILRDALSLYAFIVNELQREGRQLAIVKNGSEVEKIIVVPGLQTRPLVVGQLAALAGD